MGFCHHIDRCHALLNVTCLCMFQMNCELLCGRNQVPKHVICSVQNVFGVEPVVAHFSVKDSKGTVGRASTSLPSYLRCNGSFGIGLKRTL